MSKQTEELINNGWKLVRDAGATVGEAGSRVSTSLVRSYPHVKEWLSAGAGLALARRGGKVAVTAIRRHPVAAIAGAVALAGLGLAVAAAKRRRELINGEAPARTSKRLAATNMRTAKPKSADAATKAKPRAARKPSAPRTPRVRKPAET
ncbi:MAG: hypothetical protein A3E01_06270 [Gammaproteobacteria bacterium RIFCSPHIGHO2_12_FULL_63_22]|nr:MAG: hypothetical protein A3E01_06270 [Gammaproteobacteria bacterium RIFCSPHIGHO2_12_FULL_63_22]